MLENVILLRGTQLEFGGTMKHIITMTAFILAGFVARAEIKRIVVDLDYKTLKITPTSKKQSAVQARNAKKVKVYIPNEMIGIAAKPDDDVTCLTHTGSLLTVLPKQQMARVDNTKGDEFSYLIVSAKISTSTEKQVLSNYVLDDGRKVVTAFVVGETTGSGYYIRHGGEISPKFACSKN